MAEGRSFFYFVYLFMDIEQRCEQTRETQEEIGKRTNKQTKPRRKKKIGVEFHQRGNG